MFATAPPYLLITVAACLAWRCGRVHRAPCHPRACSPLGCLLLAGAVYTVLYWAIQWYMVGALILMQVRSDNAAICRFGAGCLPHWR